MKVLMIYAIESSICLALFWMFFVVVLRKDTRHERNRAFLLVSLLLSAVIPLLSFRLPYTDSLFPQGGLSEILLPEVRIDGSGAHDRNIPDYWNLILIIYIAGFVLTGIRLIAGSTKLLWKIIINRNNDRVIVTDDNENICYSAFGHIFISRNIDAVEAGRMIAHEKNHINKLHHYDLVISGIVNVIQWFNPAAWLTGRSLQALHEYEADNNCILNGEEIISYQQLLVSSAIRARTAILSDTFSNNSLLKNRIIMMTKKKSGSIASLKLIMAVPVAALLIFAFSCKQKESAPQTTEKQEGKVVYRSEDAPAREDVFVMVEDMPTFPGGDSALISYIYNNIEYPAKAKEKGIQGKVILRFVVDKTGEVKDVEVVRGVDPLLDQAAFDVIKNLPQWNPGKQNGNPVCVYYSVPVTFQLQ